MVDVLLVLLIIFMAAIPSMRKSIDVQLPDKRSPPKEGTPSIVLELDAAGGYAINGSSVAHDELAARVHAIYDQRPEKVLFVKGSGKLRYGDVVAAMDVWGSREPWAARLLEGLVGPEKLAALVRQ